MENKENYIRKDIVKSVEKAIIEIFNCNNRSSDLSVVEVIETARNFTILTRQKKPSCIYSLNIRRYVLSASSM